MLSEAARIEVPTSDSSFEDHFIAHLHIANLRPLRRDHSLLSTVNGITMAKNNGERLVQEVR